MEKLLAAVEQTHGFDFGESAVATGLENSAVIRGEISEQISGGARPSGDLPPAPLPAVIGDGEKRKRGRPPKGQAAAAKPPPPKRKKIEEEEDEDVCFICFDGGSLILCDRKGCPKAYHPACIKRDEAFFSTKAKWFCGWHICRTCMKTSHYMCYTCTYSLCKNCIKDADFLCVRGNKGFCTSCMKTIMQFENKDQATNEAAQIDFDDTTSFEYFFKLYWLILKENLSLTMSELMQAKNPWKASTSYRSSEHLELNKPHLDSNSIQNDELKTSISSSCNHVDTSIKKDTAIPKQDKVTEEMSVKEAAKESCIEKDQDVPAVKDTNKLSICKNERESDNSGIVSCQWATKDLLEFVAHMRNGDMSPIPQFDVQTLVIDYIKRNNLRDPRRKSQIICDPRLKNLFGKPRVGHIEMLKLLELHFLVKEDSQQHSLIPAGFVNSVASVVEPAPVNSRKRKTRRKRGITTPPDGLDECAAIDVHNINLVYLRRNLMENLIDDCDNFSNKVIGSFVRIRISSNDQKPEIFRLVQVQGIRKVAEPYKVGDKTTDVMLEVKNLDKIEVVSIDAISNLEFTEDECRRLRQTIRCGLMQHLTVGDIQRKALAIQSVRVNDWLEIEVLRLNHLQNRASEKGHKKELREYVDRLELLKSPEERQRRISEIPEIHTDPKMSPMYESEDDKINGDNREIDVQVRPNHPPYPRNRRKSVSPNKKGKDERTDPLANSPCADHIETEKLWHYRDPNGRIQGPFSMMQLRKWSTTGLFPPDMRIWTNHELFDSLLLSDALVGKLHGASDSLDKPPREKDEATGEIVVPEATNRTSSDHKQAEVPSPDKNTEHVTADEPASSGWPHCWDLLKDSSSKPDDVQSHNLLPSSSSGKEDVALSIRGQESDGEKNSVGLTQNPIVMESVPVLPPVSESPTSNKQSENIEVLDFPSPTPMTENQQSVLADVPVQDSGILELLSPAPRSNNEHQEDQATENKQSGFTLFPNPMPGWNCDSSLGIDTLQIPEVGDPWNGYSPTPARPEWDSGLVSGSSSKPPEVISECIDTSVTHASTSQPAPNWLELKNEPIEFDALGEESVSDLLAEVDAMESRGFPSPTSAMKFVRELFEDCQDDCFSSIEEFQPIKSDALSSTTDVPPTSQSSAPCKPMGSSASSEGETNAPAQYGDAASESHPHGPNNPGQEMVGASGHGSGLEATDQGWGTVQGNINLVTVQGNVNLVLVGGPGQGMGNINWGSNPGPAWTNQSTSRSPRNGSLPWDGQRKYSGERFSSPREWGGYQGGGDSRGRPPWGRQSYGGGGGGGGGYSRPLPKGQRVCKFYESGHCKKGAFCDYLHP